MDAKRWLAIIGIGEDGWEGLDPQSRQLILDADHLFGGTRHLAMIEAHSQAQPHPWTGKLDQDIAQIKSLRHRPVTVLASGDPMHFGIGATLMRSFRLDEVWIRPALSSFALAAARMGWDLARLRCLSAHGRPLDRIAGSFHPRARLLVLGQDEESGCDLARLLCANGYADTMISALSSLGGAQEACITRRADLWDTTRIPSLTIFALALGQGRASADAAHYRQDGPVLDDDLLDHDGVMTKADIRAITMAHLAPFPGGMLWDLGAGCGSISVEWARAGGQAIAVELEARRTAMIANNLARFGLGGVEILCESIADFLNRDRAAPDAVFAGGGFASHPDLLMRIWHCLRPGGVLVANSVTLEGGMRLQAMQQARPGLLTRIAVERCSRVGSLHALRPAMPILQYCGRKTG